MTAANAEPAGLEVLLFAGLAERAESHIVRLAWQSGSVAELRHQLAARLPDAVPLLERSSVAVNGGIVVDAAVVKAGDEVAVLPPVSGG
jgi:molybdopterin converting factor small subunit